MTDRKISLVEFASGRQNFHPDEWSPHSLTRGPRAGKPVFRRKVGRGWQYIDNLPPGYRQEGKRVVRDSDNHAVSLPLVNPTPSNEMYPADYASGNPYHVYNAAVRGLAAYPDHQRDRLHRLALLAMAETEANQLDPAAAALVPHAYHLADNPGSPTAGSLVEQAEATRWMKPRDYHVIHAATPFDRRLPRDNPPHHCLYQAVVGSSRDMARSPALVPVAAAHAQAIRSIARVGPSLTIPVNPDITAIARTAYEHPDRSRRRAAMLVLSDALEEHGAPQQVLDNLRHLHSADRGNWVLDAILGKR